MTALSVGGGVLAKTKQSKLPTSWSVMESSHVVTSGSKGAGAL